MKGNNVMSTIKQLKVGDIVLVVDEAWGGVITINRD